MLITVTAIAIIQIYVVSFKYRIVGLTIIANLYSKYFSVNEIKPVA